MPIYTCTTNDATLTASMKAELAGEIARIHSAINHVPSTYVNVVFHELPADAVYTDGRPAAPVLVSGWVRAGHPEADITRLAAEIAAAVTRLAGFPPTGCWSCLKAAQHISPSRAVGCCPSRARNKPGSQAAEFADIVQVSTSESLVISDVGSGLLTGPR